MKQIVQLVSITLLLSLTSLNSYAQNNAIDKYFSEYADDDRFTKVSISSKMFSLFTNFNNIEGSDEKQLVETISKLKGLKMVIGNELDAAKQLYKSANQTASSSYEELMTIENKDQELIFYINENNGTISELVMISYEVNQFIILSLIGDIDLKELSKLSNTMDIEGFDEFKNLENK